jgi:hypothetical protein
VLLVVACTGGAPRATSLQEPPPRPATSQTPAPPSLFQSSTTPAPVSGTPDDATEGPAGCAPAGGSGRDLTVGPGKKFANLGDVPFESLSAGDAVRIFWREQPYREKLMISGIGTAKNPIRVCGVPGPRGQLPVIDGRDATTRRQLDFPYDGHQVRGLVIVGHAHDQPWAATPSHIVIEGLEVRNSAPPYAFTDRAGKKSAYSAIAAGIFVERANHLTIRGCTVTANNNGMFIGGGGDDIALTRDVLIEGNHIHGNGSIADYYEHNVYNEASNVVYQFNRFGAPRSGKDGYVLGANIKERSAGVVIRFNWIEDGAHILDIVDAQEAKGVTRAMPSFHTTYVYGNVIIRGTAPSGSLIHYGGDSGMLADYRKGTLFFYNNTVVIKNDRYPEYTSTGIFEISTNEEHLESRNNIYFSNVAPDAKHPIGMLADRDKVSSGLAAFAGDWVKTGWTAHDLLPGSKVDLKAKITGLEKVVHGVAPGFRDAAAEDYAVLGRNGAGAAPALGPEIVKELLPTLQYVKHQRGKPRGAAPALGALSD